MRHYAATAVLATILAVIAVPAQAQDATDPAAVYENLCATCHGDEMQGGNAQSMVDNVWQFGGTSNYISRSIKHGATHLGMPAYEAVLEDDVIKSLAKYILSKETESGVIKPPPPTSLQTLDYEIDVEIWLDDLEIPWSIDFIDEKTALLTERPGRLWVVRNGIKDAEPVSGTPKVLHEGQGGLMDVAVDPEYAENGWIYLAYSHVRESDAPGRPPAMTRIARAHIKDGAWTDEQIIFDADPKNYVTTRHHYGGRIAFDKAGYLYFSIGERGIQDHAQDLSRPNGKVHRIHRDGRIPKDNPFVDNPDAVPSIYSYGNRNPQGLAVSPVTDDVWVTEHGPLGGDEANLIRGGVNYGWPEITYGRNYNGTVLTEFPFKPGMAQPNLYWRPSIAVCGLDFYYGNQFPKWNNRMLVGALKYEEVRLLNVDGDKIIHQEVILKNAGRVRDVECGPGGAIYVLLNSPDVVLKLTVNKERSY